MKNYGIRDLTAQEKRELQDAAQVDREREIIKRHTGLVTLWIVTRAEKDSTLQDILSEETPQSLALQVKGGLPPEDILGWFDDRAEANQVALQELHRAKESDRSPQRLHVILVDVYAGLRRIGYTRPGAIDAMVRLGFARPDIEEIAKEYSHD